MHWNKNLNKRHLHVPHIKSIIFLVFLKLAIDPFHPEYLLAGNLRNSEDQDVMTHNTTFYQGLPFWQRKYKLS